MVPVLFVYLFSLILSAEADAVKFKNHIEVKYKNSAYENYL